ncbi:MAG: hypothetical protein ACRDH5_13425, partial [bacterium]
MSGGVEGATVGVGDGVSAGVGGATVGVGDGVSAGSSTKSWITPASSPDASTVSLPASVLMS